MGYARSGIGPSVALGDAWSDYVSNGFGPPNGQVTSPNGDIEVFDENGNPDHTILHQGSGTDADVDKDTSSPFYGWTNLQKAAYSAAQGVVVATDALSAAAVVLPGDSVATVPQSAIDASQARLVALAASDPTVAAALAVDKTGSFGSTVAARSAVDQAADNAQTVADANMWADSIAKADPQGFSPADQAAWVDNYVATVSAGAPPGLSLDEAVQHGLMTAAEATAITNGASSGPAASSPTTFVSLQNGKFVDAQGNPLPTAQAQAAGVSVTSSTPPRLLTPSSTIVDIANGPVDPTLAVAGGSGSSGIPTWALVGGGLALLGVVVLPHLRKH